ncbi:hypothetical protein COBT_000828 [Conglomerata obtusa]
MKGTIISIFKPAFFIALLAASSSLRHRSAYSSLYLGATSTKEENESSKKPNLEFDLQCKAHLAYKNKYRPYHDVFASHRNFQCYPKNMDCGLCSHFGLTTNTDLNYDRCLGSIRLECPDALNNSHIATSTICDNTISATNENVLDITTGSKEIDNSAFNVSLERQSNFLQDNPILGANQMDDSIDETLATTAGQENWTNQSLRVELAAKYKSLQRYILNKERSAQRSLNNEKKNNLDCSKELSKESPRIKQFRMSKTTPADTKLDGFFKNHSDTKNYIGDNSNLSNSLNRQFINTKIEELVGKKIKHKDKLENICKIKFNSLTDDSKFNIYKNDNKLIFNYIRQESNHTYNSVAINKNKVHIPFIDIKLDLKTNQYDIEDCVYGVLNLNILDVYSIKEYLLTDNIFNIDAFLGLLNSYGIDLKDSGMKIKGKIQNGVIMYEQIYFALQADIITNNDISNQIIYEIFYNTLELLTSDSQILFLFPQFHAFLQYIEMDANQNFYFRDKKELCIYICFLELLKVFVKLDWKLFSKELHEALNKTCCNENDSQALDNSEVMTNYIKSRGFIIYKNKYLNRIKNEIHLIICFLLFPFLKPSVFNNYVNITAYEIVYYIRFYGSNVQNTKKFLTSDSKHLFCALTRIFFSVEICSIISQENIELMHEKYILRHVNPLYDDFNSEKMYCYHKNGEKMVEKMEFKKLSLRDAPNFLKSDRLKYQIYNPMLNNMFNITNVHFTNSKKMLLKRHFTLRRYKSTLNVFLHYIYSVRYDGNYSEVQLYINDYASHNEMGDFDILNFFTNIYLYINCDEIKKSAEIIFVEKFLNIFQKTLPYYSL